MQRLYCESIIITSLIYQIFNFTIKRDKIYKTFCCKKKIYFYKKDKQCRFSHSIVSFLKRIFNFKSITTSSCTNLFQFIQIWANFSNGHTGQLSVISQSLIAFGSLARVFTTIQETGDMLMTSQFVLACSLNCLILGQIFWYWNALVPKPKKE